VRVLNREGLPALVLIVGGGTRLDRLIFARWVNIVGSRKRIFRPKAMIDLNKPVVLLDAVDRIACEIAESNDLGTAGPLHSGSNGPPVPPLPGAYKPLPLIDKSAFLRKAL